MRLFDVPLALRSSDVSGTHCVGCSPPCWWTRCADCGVKLSTHDSSEEESQRFARSSDHRCKR